MIGFGDIQAAQEAAAKTAVLIPPPTAAALPEDVAWDMVRAEGGAMAVLLAVAVTVLWRIISRVLRETRSQNQALMDAQLASIAKLSEAVGKVEGAIKISDANNLHAITRLSEAVQSSIARLDKHESKLDAHHDSILTYGSRIAYLESRRTPGSIPIPIHSTGK